MTGVMLKSRIPRRFAHATVVIAVDVNAEAKTLRAKRELEGGINETVEMPTPALLTVQFGINQPRYASLKGIMAAKKKEMKAWSAADLGLADDQVGRPGAMYDIKEVLIPERKSRVEMLTGSPEEAAGKLVEKLRKEAKVL